jgi:hypothetical protein
MSSQTTAPSAPFQQWQSFYPSAPAGPYGFGYDQQPVSIQDQIYASVTGNAERTKQQAANDIARDILRAVDQGTALNSHATEITAAQLASAIERNGNANQSTTERVNSQLASSVERNGAANQSTTERVNNQLASAVDRNGSATLSAIERTTGEARLTTVIADAASRQAANDSTRDVLRTLDRVGGETVTATKDSFATLLGTSERIAGENRITTLTSSGILENSLRDVRYSILTDINRIGNDLNASNVQTFNVLNKSITDSAWENRSALASGFQNISEEHLHTKFDLSAKAADHYSSLMLESQKLGHFMSAKADGHFAAGQLELQKVKEGLATQSAVQYAAAQLDAHKNREAIQKDLCEARYEALKSQQYLTDKMSECCCTIKEKIDLVDRDRLRDNLLVARDDNNLLKVLEFGGRGGERGYGYGGRRRGGSRSRSPGRR